MKLSLNAASLRILLFGLIALVIVGTAGAFYFVQGRMRVYADSISVLNADVEAGAQNIQTLKTLEKRLDEENAIAEKARAIVAESQEYVYQDSIVTDISKIARLSGVVVKNFTFSEASSSPTAPATGAAPAAPTTPIAPTMPTASASTVNTRTVNVDLVSPVSYTSVMNFIRQIEKNPLKMQISSVSLQKFDENPALVVPQSFTIKVYVR